MRVPGCRGGPDRDRPGRLPAHGEEKDEFNKEDTEMRKYAKKLITLLLAVCLLASVMPVAMAIPYTAIPEVSPIDLNVIAERNDEGFELLYQAVTWINEEQADLVMIHRNRKDKLEKLVFECDLRDEAIDLLPEGYVLPDFYFSSVQVGPDKDELFIPLSEPYVDRGNGYNNIVLKYQLNPKVVEELFPTMSEDELRYDLMRPMGMSLHTDAPEFVPDGILKNVKTLHTIAAIFANPDVYLNDFGVTVPEFPVTMAHGELETPLTETRSLPRTSLKQDADPFMQGYPDDTFKPDGAITRAEVSQVLSRLLDAPAKKAPVAFSDVDPDAWYAKAVSELAALGYLKGGTDGKFRPNAPITRAEMAALLVRFAEGEADAAASFSDVPAAHWAYDAINTAAAYGWINGVGDGRFSPDRPITRAEAAKLICAVLGRSADKVALAMGLGRQFADVSADHWAYAYIADAATARESVKFGSFEIWTAAK